MARNGPFGEFEAGIWITQVVLAIDHMHGRNLLHRDIKPANIFITRSGIIKVGDLGCCKMLGQPDEEGTSEYDSPLYRSPEVWRNGICSHKSDIWAIGCVAYELLAQEPPFCAPDLPFKVLSTVPKDLPTTYSRGVRTLVNNMLQKEPALRPGTTDLLKSEELREHVQRWMQAAFTPPDVMTATLVRGA